MLASGAQFVGDHEALPPRVAENRGVAGDLAVGRGDAFLARAGVLEHRDVDVKGYQLLAVDVDPREPDPRQQVADACVENAPPVPFGERVQALAKGFLRGDVAAHEPPEENVGTELFNVGVAAVAGGHEANAAADNCGRRIEGIWRRGQFGVPILHADVSIQLLFYKGKTAIRVDFFGTLHKFHC